VGFPQRIEEALEKHHEIHELKKTQFQEREREAAIRAKEIAVKEAEMLRKQADDREKRNKARITRLVDAYTRRADYRDSIVERRNEKNKVLSDILCSYSSDMGLPVNFWPAVACIIVRFVSLSSSRCIIARLV